MAGSVVLDVLELKEPTLLDHDNDSRKPETLESTSLDENTNSEATRDEEIKTLSDKAHVDSQAESRQSEKIEVVPGNDTSNSTVPHSLRCTQLELSAPESPAHPTGTQSELSAPESPAHPTVPENFRLILAGSVEEIHTVETNKRKKVELVAPKTGPSIYNIKDDCSYISPPLIPGRLAEAFESLPVFREPDSRELNKTKLLRDFIGCDIDEDEFDKLGMYCSTENLRTGDEISMPTMEPRTGFAAALAIKEHLASAAYARGAGDSLHTVRKYGLLKAIEKQHIYSRKRKYRGVRFLKLDEPKGGDGDKQNPLVPGKDLVFRVRIYRPFSYSPRERKRHGSRHPHFVCDLVLLGRHTLAELRDRVACVNDQGLRLDVSDRPDYEPLANCKEMFPSGFLFINNVFYNDKRPGCSDYSAPIREWAEKRNIGKFSAEDMGTVRLDQLTIRLGYPEVYVHQGNCEHLFTFSEVRLVGLGEPRRASLFPRHTSATGNNCLYCTTCAEYPANWVVTGSTRVPFDPALFCGSCFRLYMYVDGKKCGDFKAVPFKGNEMETVPA